VDERDGSSFHRAGWAGLVRCTQCWRTSARPAAGVAARVAVGGFSARRPKRASTSGANRRTLRGH
jgi:hypothetical protein